MQTPTFLKIFTDKKQREHFWYYYKGHVAVVSFILILLIMTAVDYIKNDQPVFQVVYVNVPSTIEQDWTQHLLNASPFGSDREIITESVTATDSIGITELEAAVTHICAQISAGEIDIFIAEQDVFRQFAQGELFEDLQLCLPEEFIEFATDSLYYSNVDGVECVTGLIWEHPSSGVSYVFSIPFSSTLKESAAVLIQSLFQKGAAQ